MAPSTTDRCTSAKPVSKSMSSHFTPSTLLTRSPVVAQVVTMACSRSGSLPYSVRNSSAVNVSGTLSRFELARTVVTLVNVRARSTIKIHLITSTFTTSQPASSRVFQNHRASNSSVSLACRRQFKRDSSIWEKENEKQSAYAEAVATIEHRQRQIIARDSEGRLRWFSLSTDVFFSRKSTHDQKDRSYSSSQIGWGTNAL